MTNTERTPFPASETVVVTDSGLETWLMFERGIDLPAFAAYPLAATTEGKVVLTEYYEQHMAVAESVGAAVELEAPTWRANPDWAATLGHDREALAGLIEDAVGVVDGLRNRWRGAGAFLVGGAVGPRGDRYRIDVAMTADQADEYHSFRSRTWPRRPSISSRR
jgi:homocysteine S-methyltransferase